MIYCDLKLDTSEWESNKVEVCFGSRKVLREFISILKARYCVSESLQPKDIDIHDKDLSNLSIMIMMNKPSEFVIVKSALKMICNEYECLILDY